MREGGRDVPIGRPPGLADLVLWLVFTDDVVWKHDFQKSEGVDKLQDEGGENEDPSNDDRRHVELHPEVKSHTNGCTDDSGRPTPLAVGQALPLPLPCGYDVKAKEQNMQNLNDQRCRNCHPEGFQLDVDVSEAIISKGLDVAHEAHEDRDSCVDIILDPLLLAQPVQAEVLWCNICWQVVDAGGGHCTGVVGVKLLPNPRGGLPRCPRSRRGRARPALAQLVVSLRSTVVGEVGHAEDVSPALLLELGRKLPSLVKLLQSGHWDPDLTS
mmetsp:Transcript_78172/g.141069  ORF Transcript_78172/g.141069 Transcript_78172/m.141069 type:complete len:270 (+) Transcript_78172:1577-2386(+)